VGSWRGRGADFVDHPTKRLQEGLTSGTECIVADGTHTKKDAAM
jgi:hypothetical protein